MSKLRSVNTQFWSDPWVEDLTPSEKLLYLYFITNEKTNMLGVYELSIKKISFETGIDKKTIQNALKGFERIGKVKYTNNYIVLLNYTRHQNYNTNMKKSAIDVFNSLPDELNMSKEFIDKQDVEKGFERVRKGLGMVRKVEVESETKTETELEDETKPTAKAVDFDYSKFLIFINDTFKKSLRVVNDQVRIKIKARLEEGYIKEDFIKSVKNCAKDQYHIDNGFKYCTPEYFSRAQTLDKYIDYIEGNKQQSKGAEHVHVEKKRSAADWLKED